LTNVAGGGPAPVLLLHGQPGSSRDWDGVVAALGQTVRAITFDRPGWDGRRAPVGLAGNADAALQVLDVEGIGQATVVGHSFAGAVAAWLALHHPDRVSSLVLAAPSANVASLYEFDRWLAAPIAGEVASAAVLSAAGLALVLAPLRRRLARQLGVDDRYLGANAQRLLRPAAWRSFVVEQRALIRDLPALESALGRIGALTTIVGGTEDRIVPVSSLRQLREQIPGAELVLLERAGHLLPLQHAVELAEVVRGASA
jgi:pimeloyl-ACP methyl ester carboxylesterase